MNQKRILETHFESLLTEGQIKEDDGTKTDIEGIRSYDLLESKIQAQSHDFMALMPTYFYNNGIKP